MKSQKNIRGWILYSSDNRLRVSESYEISRLCTEFSLIGFEIKVIEIIKLTYFLSSTNEIVYLYSNKIIDLPKFVINRLGVLNDDSSMLLMFYLKHQNVLLLNGFEGIQKSMDKSFMYFVLSLNKLPIANTLIISKLKYDTIRNFPFEPPIIYKLPNGTQGIGTLLFNDVDRLNDFFEMSIFQQNPKHHIIQEYLDYKVGEAIRVLILGNKIISSYRKRSRSNFKATARYKSKIEFIKVNKDVELISLKAARVFNLDFVGIDLIEIADNKYVISDINSSPSFFTTEKLNGANLAEKIVQYVSNKLQ